ncbi:unnamed protein product [Rotaria magnacalcarata]|uniref:EF-hand domain-containing protein n=2 Tax=Rotaria magnacalcarata TaxID=392030 RepID=A0A816U438_9BILA|nr:unnamed protein product [Rotaria magnacalcarata]CAF1620738.1 unnamed protein product [Rotaria magnacalcarata]CAF2093245.1 unnamed protein product [Rotaria magnacalcarata]CAF2104508.1 unnamed protein product [Rotaria magnacalcarata]
MWHAVETSIPTHNKTHQVDTSLKKNATPSHPISRPACSVAELMKRTKFSRDQIRHLYRTFKQDSPSGQVNREQLAMVFATLFPTGESHRYSVYVFQNIDRLNTNIIRFEDMLATFSLLVYGSMKDRLGWIFDLYDLDKDGVLTRPELFQLIASIFQLIIPTGKLDYRPILNTIEKRTDELFRAWDIHEKGSIYKEDFLQYCLQNETIIRSMDKLKPEICL